MRKIQFQNKYYYHIYNRGAHGVSLFREEENDHFVLRKVKHYAAEFELSMIAYCLMPRIIYCTCAAISTPTRLKMGW